MKITATLGGHKVQVINILHITLLKRFYADMCFGGEFDMCFFREHFDASFCLGLTIIEPRSERCSWKR